LCVGDFSHAYIIVHQYFGLQKNYKKWQNQSLKSTKHDFSCVYFLHKWLASKARNLELSEYKQLTKWLKKGIISFVTLCFKIKKLWEIL
jgi:hypothetical protein